MARIIIVMILLTGIFAGGLLYYQQVYAYYDEVQMTPDAVALTSVTSAQPEPLLIDTFDAIDANSSPLRYRACFTTPISLATLTETYQIVDEAEPRVAPGWFDCFDAVQLGADLRDEAVAFLGTENIVYGIDRIVAVYPDGRGYVWHQINACGEVVFDGEPAPEGCPTPPESQE